MMEETRLILSHPTGNANVRALLEGLEKKGMLQEFYTCIALFENSRLYPFTGRGPLKEFRKRLFSAELEPYTQSRPFYEMGRLISQKLGNPTWTRHETGTFCIDKVYRDLDKYVSEKLGNTAVYAYEDGALQTFQQAKLKGALCLYDLPIGYWRAMRNLLEKERSEKPEWAETLQNFKDSDEKLERKDEELHLADHIFVASSFTAETLKSYPGELAPVSMIPYGFPPVAKNRKFDTKENRPLQVLFVGGLSQRKGISYLFEAAESLKGKVELTVVGLKPTETCEVLNQSLARHRWMPSLPHSAILDLMRSQDLLIFPSLFEGFGLVVTEAMSQGTPVITTKRTCGADLIRHSENGWLVEAGSTEAIRLQLEEILENRKSIEQVGRAAMETAKKRPWSSYGEEMARAVGKVLSNEKVRL